MSFRDRADSASHITYVGRYLTEYEVVKHTTAMLIDRNVRAISLNPPAQIVIPAEDA